MFKQIVRVLIVSLFMCTFAGCIDEYSVPSPPASNIQYPVYTPSPQAPSASNTAMGEVTFVFQKLFVDSSIEHTSGTENYRKLIIAYVGSTEVGRSEFDIYNGGSLDVRLPCGNYVIKLRGFNVWDSLDIGNSEWNRQSSFMKEKDVSVLIGEESSPEIKLWYGWGGFPINADL